MRVLLVVDYSAGSNHTVREFAERSWPSGMVVRLLSVVENIPPSAAELWFDAGGSFEAVMKARKENCEELVANMAGLLRAKGFTVEEAVRCGRRRKVIATEAKAWSAELVIIGSQGFRDME